MRPAALARLGAYALVLLLAACETAKTYDYTNFRAHPPRSILVLPPLNESTNVDATYGYLSTVSFPIAERGYYVFPVEEVDRFFQENGMPTAGEMHQVSPARVFEITGADAVMFITVERYGTEYQVLSSVTSVKVHARLVDTRTQLLLWVGEGAAAESGSSGGGIIGQLVAAAVAQALNASADRAHTTSRLANERLFGSPGVALPYGPYSPRHDAPY